LDKKIGPLPVGVWIAVVVGGLAIGYFMNRRQSNGNSEGEGTGEGDGGVGRGGSGFDPVLPTPPAESLPETNHTWGIKVSNWLISQNYTPTVASNTVNKYLSGMDLTLQEAAIMNLALAKFGVPPEPLPPTKVPQPPPAAPQNLRVTSKLPTGDGVFIAWDAVAGATGYRARDHRDKWWETVAGAPSMFWGGLEAGKTYTVMVVAYNDNGESAPGSLTFTTSGSPSAPPPPAAPAPPAPPPAPAPPQQRTWTIDPGDTLWDISGKVYGSNWRWKEIYNANAGVIEATARNRGYASSEGGKWIFPGTVLVIP
jgi:hypothetical protein